jgi:hypothetical protein
MKKRDSSYENESMTERSEKSERMLWTFVFRTIALTTTGNRTSSGYAGRLFMPASSSGGTQGDDCGIGSQSGAVRHVGEIADMPDFDCGASGWAER